MRNTINNLSLLVGAKIDHQKWNPYAAYFITKPLEIVSLMSLNTPRRRLEKEGYQCTFRNETTLLTAEIFDAVRDFNKEVLDETYLMAYQRDIDRPVGLKELFFSYAHVSKINDSVFVEHLNQQKEMQQEEFFPYLLLVLLDSFSLRYALYDFIILEKDDFIDELVESRFLRLIENIFFVKALIEEWDPFKGRHLNQFLTYLLQDVQYAKEELRTVIKEV